MESVPQYIHLPTHFRLQSVHCNESLVWFKIFCDIVDFESSLGPPPCYPVVALCYGDPEALDKHNQPFRVSQMFSGDKYLRVGQLKALDLHLDGS